MPAPQRVTDSARTRFMRIGLRSRLTIAFALGALLLSALLSVIAYTLVRESLVRQRESSVVRQTYVNALLIRGSLSDAGGVQAVLDGLATPTGSSPILFRSGQWFAANPVERGREQLPVELRQIVTAGEPARMRFDLDGEPYLGVGVPVPAADAAYFEIASFGEVETSLSSLALALFISAAVATVAGALLGAVSSRRVLHPLSPIAAAAEAIAGGRLDTRVARVDDPDIGLLIDSFNHMASALQARIEREARFASDISHELRSPLTTLTASVGVIEARREELPERARAALDLLVADVKRFATMVDDLLEISRFDAGAAHLQLERVRLGELVLAAVAAASPDRDPPVSVSAEAAAALVDVDKRRMVRVLANLLGNAERYGGGATLVSVKVADGSHVRLAVEDAGPGVRAEDRRRVFERFTRGTDEAGRRGLGEGVGLGLALVEEHVRLHGGRVWAEDRPDGAPGARIVVELPLVAATESDLDAEPVDLGPAAVPAGEVGP